MLGLGCCKKVSGLHPKGLRNSTDQIQQHLSFGSPSPRNIVTISWVYPAAFCSLSNIKESSAGQFKHQSFMLVRSSFLFAAMFTAKGCAVGKRLWSTLPFLFLGLPELRQGKGRLLKWRKICFYLACPVGGSLLAIRSICLAGKCRLSHGAHLRLLLSDLFSAQNTTTQVAYSLMDFLWLSPCSWHFTLWPFAAGCPSLVRLSCGWVWGMGGEIYFEGDLYQATFLNV